MADIRVHIDTLEYTRSGLRTRESLSAIIGENNRIVLVRPDRAQPLGASYGGFPLSSSFPGPAVLALMRRVHRDNRTASSFQIFAHADDTGSDQANKELTENRADAARALLVGDVDRLTDIWRLEDWDDMTFQVILRALGCDPGSIDDILGDVSTQAITSFQERYNERHFAAASSLESPPPRFDALKVNGLLGPDTKEALVESYVLAFTPGVSENALGHAHSVNGCAAFNRVVDDGSSSLNRRVSLVAHDSAPAYADAAPCTVGDEQACAVVDNARARCMWFREHVDDREPSISEHEHFFPSWLRLPNGRFMLSVLTTVPEEESVEFEVWRSSEPVDGVETDSPYLQTTLSAVVRVHPIRGVAQIVWEPPEGFAPSEAGRVEDHPDEAWVPVFRVRHPGSSSGQAAVRNASYPGRALLVLFSRAELGGTFEASDVHELELLCDDGTRQRRPASAAIPYDQVHYALRFEGFPKAGRFRLVAHHGDQTQHVVFDDVGYGQLESRESPDTPKLSTGAHWWTAAEDAFVEPPPELSHPED